ncbi:recombination mediator RecR [Thiomicrospira sp. R3]|uniref:recombination mediator RecR n=1 Tax=Thiomicrospira sp. R3 TaxID=3035472 RepID=UPI00259BAFBD|nr:recombination mediator RecR [Thiomicrospira sp. R3]WFE67996.1 recombination mediator RecR [Thiomicrospira sp. R3]
MSSPLIQQLIDAFRILPGVGPKSAQRMAYAILERQREGGKQLAWTLSEALDKVGHCSSCRTLSEEAICRICSSTKRNAGLLCVVETPADVLSIEQAGIYQGKYFVLMGHLSPIDGIGPAQLGLDLLKTKLQQPDIVELILATNQTVEGEATAHYIQQMAQQLGVNVTRLAQGLPMGGELEYTDSATLSYAFKGRRRFD